MKALSIQNPYATDILNGDKPIEFRTWKTNHRGDLLIVSSKNPKFSGMLSGHALCVVTLADIRPSEEYDGYYEWLLENVRPIEPFPVKGKLNLYNVDDSLIKYK